MSHKKIAEIYRVSQMTITKLLQKLRIKARMRNEYDKYILRNDEMSNMLSKWYQEYNLSLRDIAGLLGVAETTVGKFMKEIGLKTRSHSESLKVHRKVDLNVLNREYESSIKHKKWRHGRKDAYHSIKCDHCGRIFPCNRSLASKRTFHFCGYQYFRDYSSSHGFLAGRHPNVAELEMLEILQGRNW